MNSDDGRLFGNNSRTCGVEGGTQQALPVGGGNASPYIETIAGALYPTAIDVTKVRAAHRPLVTERAMREADGNSALYTDLEKEVLDYAQAIVRSEQAACRRLRESLQKTFSADALIELTALIAYQAMSALFNVALEIPPHGFCQVKKKS